MMHLPLAAAAGATVAASSRVHASGPSVAVSLVLSLPFFGGSVAHSSAPVVSLEASLRV